jgi:hypothetical protein
VVDLKLKNLTMTSNSSYSSTETESNTSFSEVNFDSIVEVDEAERGSVNFAPGIGPEEVAENRDQA